MEKNLFQRLSRVCLVSLLLLLLAGAVVRVTGSGMGCPDWPTCWGCLIPPTSVEQVDFESLKIERFKKKAERAGRNPDEITIETLRHEFNPKHTWIEFINRCLTLPLGFISLGLLGLALFGSKKRLPSLRVAAGAVFVLILVNAWMGARIVYSGLQPGTITAHMAMAMLLLCVLAYMISYSGDRNFMKSQPQLSPWFTWIGVLLFVLTVAEGILGSQVRELTDELGKAYPEGDREAWSEILKHSTVYLVHRSFSWVIFALGLAVGWLGWKQQSFKTLEIITVVIVIAQMLMGVMLSHWGVFGVIQVLHVFASALLLLTNIFWLLNRRLQWRA